MLGQKILGQNKYLLTGKKVALFLLRYTQRARVYQGEIVTVLPVNT